MTTIAKFEAANKRVEELEATGLFLTGYGAVESTQEYEAALAEAQDLYNELANNGINPF